MLEASLARPVNPGRDGGFFARTWDRRKGLIAVSSPIFPDAGGGVRRVR